MEKVQVRWKFDGKVGWLSATAANDMVRSGLVEIVFGGKPPSPAPAPRAQPLKGKGKPATVAEVAAFEARRNKAREREAQRLGMTAPELVRRISDASRLACGYRGEASEARIVRPLSTLTRGTGASPARLYPADKYYQ